jgi:two-component system phosphate regulon response regulator PhoB
VESQVVKASILVAENDIDVRTLLRIVLEKEGYQVILAADGVEALWLVQTRRPDLVLLNAMMPRMSGLETCRRIREISDTPIIILTCLAGKSDMVRGVEIGADDYVTLPFNRLEFAARVRAALIRSVRHPATEQATRLDDRRTVGRARSAGR